MNATSGVVHVIDDDASLRRSLARLLRAHGFVAEAFDSAGSFLSAGLENRTGCIVLDLHMPAMDGLELQEQLVQARCRMPILFLTARGDVQKCARAFKTGAFEFLVKPVDEVVLLDAIRKALEQNRLAEESHALIASIQVRMDQLTDREREVMRHLITGALNKQIGGDLDIAEKTVKVHRARVLAKMGVTSVAELVRLCTAAGVDPRH